MRWCEKRNLDNEQDLTDCHLAYYNAFLATEQGKEVLCDLMNAACMFDIVGPDDAQDHRVASNFIKSILSKCGATNPQAMIDAYAEIGKNWRAPIPKPEPGPMETDKSLL